MVLNEREKTRKLAGWLDAAIRGGRICFSSSSSSFFLPTYSAARGHVLELVPTAILMAAARAIVSHICGTARWAVCRKRKTMVFEY